MESFIPLIISGVYFLSQLGITGLLIWRAARPAAHLRVVERVFYILFLVFAPSVAMLVAIGVFSPEWKGEHAHGWFGVIDVNYPGLMIFPVWIAACVFVFLAILKDRWLFASKRVFVAIAVLAVICFWYTGMFPIYTGITGQGSGGLSVNLSADSPEQILLAVVLAGIPAAACLNLLLLMFGIRRRGELTGPIRSPIFAWLAALLATAAAKCVAAVYYYESLPDEPPSCFVVTAAARGHASFVGSRADPATGRRVNRQLRTLWAVESRLIERHPRLHAGGRRVYNVVGPAVAGRIRSRIAADAMFIILKPIELLGACYLRCSRGSKGG